MDILQGECQFCREHGLVVSEDVGEICHACSRKVVIAFCARLHGEDSGEVETFEDEERSSTSNPHSRNLREVTTDEEVGLDESIFSE